MLLDFAVANYRSIRDEVLLSAVAAVPPKRAGANGLRSWVLRDEEVAPGRPVEGRGFSLLPVLGVFGPNASGKSNLVQALSHFIAFAADALPPLSAMVPLWSPFMFDEASRSMPSSFRLRVALGPTLYEYELSVMADHVAFERLSFNPVPGGRWRALFRREWAEATPTHSWAFGPSFPRRTRAFTETLPIQVPFLAALGRYMRVEPLAPLIAWMRAPSFPIALTGSDHQSIEERFAFKLYQSSDELREAACELMRRFDVTLAGLHLTDPNGNADVSGNMLVLHDSEAGRLPLPLTDESQGTRRLLTLTPRLLLALRNGLPCVIDEFGALLHPNVAKLIVEIFQNPVSNPKGAQLVFASHQSELLHRGVLRRDEIWLTNRTSEGNTTLVPLTDYKVRSDVPIDRWFLDGRFGAAPFLDDEETTVAGLTTAVNEA